MPFWITKAGSRAHQHCNSAAATAVHGLVMWWGDPPGAWIGAKPWLFSDGPSQALPRRDSQAQVLAAPGEAQPGWGPVPSELVFHFRLDRAVAGGIAHAQQIKAFFYLLVVQEALIRLINAAAENPARASAAGSARCNAGACGRSFDRAYRATGGESQRTGEPGLREPVVHQAR